MVCPGKKGLAEELYKCQIRWLAVFRSVSSLTFREGSWTLCSPFHALRHMWVQVALSTVSVAFTCVNAGTCVFLPVCAFHWPSHSPRGSGKDTSRFEKVRTSSATRDQLWCQHLYQFLESHPEETKWHLHAVVHCGRGLHTDFYEGEQGAVAEFKTNSLFAGEKPMSVSRGVDCVNILEKILKFQGSHGQPQWVTRQSEMRGSSENRLQR